MVVHRGKTKHNLWWVGTLSGLTDLLSLELAPQYLLAWTPPFFLVLSVTTESTNWHKSSRVKALCVIILTCVCVVILYMFMCVFAATCVPAD